MVVIAAKLFFALPFVYNPDKNADDDEYRINTHAKTEPENRANHVAAIEGNGH
ncbi:hypothetical protein BDD43_1078 [Mucilaginibacter gracilis]|uniref:Uncharacterized protein n=1 Tax=Mucilaginibacter gracilis TaxID=423350 RepID=A0A495IW95_9SPHI|nr:hypothetical protein BDD43_1078 [Mucilaginibacter gracilis]